MDDVPATACVSSVLTTLEKLATARVVGDLDTADNSLHRAGDILRCYQLLMDGAAWAATSEVMTVRVSSSTHIPGGCTHYLSCFHH